MSAPSWSSWNRANKKREKAEKKARDARWKDVVRDSERNPLTKFQDAKGRLDLKGYEAAKDAGWAARDISDYTNIGSYTGGMSMRSKARKQYRKDIAPEDPTWKDLEQTPLTDLDDQIKEESDLPGAGHTYSSVVGKGGNIGGGESLKISPGKTDINALKRKSWKTPGKASNSSSVNV